MVLVENSLKNAYIGEYWWHPWANTLAYFPLEDDVLDHVWSNTLSNPSNLTKWTIWYNFNKKSTWPQVWCTFTNWSVKFLSIWYKLNSVTWSWNSIVAEIEKYGAVAYNSSHLESRLNNKIAVFSDSNWSLWGAVAWMSSNARHHLTVWCDGSKILISKDGVQETLYNWTGYTWWGETVSLVREWTGSGNNITLNVDLSEFICESACRSAQEILDYYNLTKSTYGY